LILPYHNDRFYFKDVTSQSVVAEMEDMRVVVYSSGYTRVEADTGVFYNLVRKGFFSRSKIIFCSVVNVY
jgi:hypothetical protein